MKKTILFILTIMTLSCGGDDSNTSDAIIGKWIIYKADYGQTVYEFEINGQCGKQALTMKADHYLTETFYSNVDCTGFVSSTWQWGKVSNGVYGIIRINSTVPERTVTMTDNEIKVQEGTLIKYYKRAQ